MVVFVTIKKQEESYISVLFFDAVYIYMAWLVG